MEISKHSLALMLRRNGKDLGAAATALGDKMTWKPLDKGRTALEQVIECAGFALLTKAMFDAQAAVPIDMEKMAAMRVQYDTPEKALALLDSAFEALGQAVEAFPAEKLGDKIILPFGGGMERSFAEVAMMTHWNTVYHEGQINYIETLTEEYVRPQR